jgi:hypothetical protein
MTGPATGASTVPTGNWRRMHRGWGEQPKRRHRTRAGALWHQRSNRRRFKVDADILWVYPCWFTDQNTLGRRHYHVGHLPRARKMTAPPQPGKLILGVFAVEDGFETRTFETRPPTCYPIGTSVAGALLECTSFPCFPGEGTS